MIPLQTLLAKQSDAEIVPEMLGFTAQRLMELDVETKTGIACAASFVRQGRA